MTMNQYTRIKWDVLDDGAETGVLRRRYVGLMSEAEYVQHILGGGVQDDLDAGAQEDEGQPDLYDELMGSTQRDDSEGWG